VPLPPAPVPPVPPPVPPVPLLPPAPLVPHVPKQLPVQEHFVELPLTVQEPAAQLNLQSAVLSHAKLQLCPALQVAVHVEFAGQFMLQLEGSASHLLLQVPPTAHA
jgi:hypothetical protein